MSTSQLVFTQKSSPPDEAALRSALGKKYTLLEKLLKENDITTSVWKFYSATSGWTLQCRRGSKNLFYLQIVSSGIRVWFTLGKDAREKAIAQITAPAIREAIETARIYAEGASFPADIQSSRDLPVVRKLTDIKVSSS